MKTRKGARGSEDPEAARLSWQLERGVSKWLSVVPANRAVGHISWVVREKGRGCHGPCLTRRGPWGPGATVPGERASWEDSGAVRAAPSRTQPAAEPPAGSAGRGARARAGTAATASSPATRERLGEKPAAVARGEAAARPVGPPPGAGQAARRERRGDGARASGGAGERSAGKSAPSGLLETRRIRFQINEIWVHTFTLLLPALMLF